MRKRLQDTNRPTLLNDIREEVGLKVPEHNAGYVSRKELLHLLNFIRIAKRIGGDHAGL